MYFSTGDVSTDKLFCFLAVREQFSTLAIKSVIGRKMQTGRNASTNNLPTLISFIHPLHHNSTHCMPHFSRNLTRTKPRIKCTLKFVLDALFSSSQIHSSFHLVHAYVCLKCTLDCISNAQVHLMHT